MGLFGRGDEDEDQATDDGPTFDDLWDVRPAHDRQWEYRVVHVEAVQEAVGGDFDTPDDVLNALGKEGWELVDTVEGRSTLGGPGNDDGMSEELLFKRPATYERRGTDPEAESPDL